jgi:hypothetical protein
MLRTTVSDRFGDLLARLLPGGLAAKAVNLFGLKVPTPPETLAGSIIEMTGSLMRQLDETVAKWPDALKKDAAGMVLGDDVAAEILCAFYAQAVAVLSEREPDDEQAFSQVYTSRTFDEMRRLLPQAGNSFEELVHETSDLYFNDHPTLAELAQQMPDYVFPPELEKVQNMKHWMVTFSLKVQIRTLGKMRVTNKHIVHDVLKIVINTSFLHSIKFFERLRPVLDGPA